MNSIHCSTEQPGGFRHRVEVRSHVFHCDELPANGGEDSAPEPHDYFDASLAACRAATAIWYAKRNAIPLERVETQVDRDASEERKGRYRLIVRTTFHGPLTDEQRRRLLAVVDKCPITKLMTTTEVVVETAEQEDERLTPLQPQPAHA